MSSPRLNDIAKKWGDHLHNLKNYTLAASIDLIRDSTTPLPDEISTELNLCEEIMNHLEDTYSRAMKELLENQSVDAEKQARILKESISTIGSLYKKLATIYSQLNHNPRLFESTLYKLSLVLLQLKRDADATLKAMHTMLAIDDTYTSPFNEPPMPLLDQLQTQKKTLYGAIEDQITLHSKSSIKIQFILQPAGSETELKAITTLDDNQLAVIRDITANCIKNAIRFMESNHIHLPTIDITFSKSTSSPYYELSFQDNGPGIKTELLSKLDKGTIASDGGHGFGLSGTRARFYAAFATTEAKPNLALSNRTTGGAQLAWQFPASALKAIPQLAPDINPEKIALLKILYIDDSVVNCHILNKKICTLIDTCFQTYKDKIQIILLGSYHEGDHYLETFYKELSAENTQKPYLLTFIDLNLNHHPGDGYDLLKKSQKLLPDYVHPCSLSASAIDHTDEQERFKGITTLNKPIDAKLIGNLIKKSLCHLYPSDERLALIDVEARLKETHNSPKSLTRRGRRLFDAKEMPSPSSSLSSPSEAGSTPVRTARRFSFLHYEGSANQDHDTPPPTPCHSRSGGNPSG